MTDTRLASVCFLMMTGFLRWIDFRLTLKRIVDLMSDDSVPRVPARSLLSLGEKVFLLFFALRCVKMNREERSFERAKAVVDHIKAMPFA